MNDRDAILAALPDAEPGERPGWKPARSSASAPDLWTEFEARFTELGGAILPPGSLKFMLDQREGSVYADEDALRFLPRTAVRATSPWEAVVGVTLADLVVAETGSVLVSAGPGRSRLASLASPVHVVLAREDAIVGRLDEAIARLPDRTSVLISGTSRTADIEGIMVRGVHGPREIYLIRV